jgi:secreted Zn-dependent insulinase-like peptidase
VNIAFVDPNFKGATSSLPYYGVKYTVSDLAKRVPGSSQWAGWLSGEISKQDIDAAVLQSLRALDSDISAVPEVRMPKAIEKIPKKITLDFAQAPLGQSDFTTLYGAEPARIEGSSKFDQIWYRQGSTSQSPRIVLGFLVRKQGGMNVNPQDAMLKNVYLRVLIDQFIPKVQDLAAAGINARIVVGPYSLSITFDGFAELLPPMMDMVAKEFKLGPDVSTLDRFNRIKESVREDLADKSDSPTAYAVKDRNLLLLAFTYSDEELQGPLEGITAEMLKTAPVAGIDGEPSMFTSLAMGNIERSQAVRASEKFMSMMNLKSSVPTSDIEIVAPVVHPKVPLEVRKLNPRADDPNSVTFMTILIGVPKVGDTVVWSIIGQVLRI